MTARWQDVKSVFLEAVERGDDERADFLEAACRDDATLRCEVDRLLAAHAEADSFLSRPAVDLADFHSEDDAIPNRVGPYKIVRELGRGGMGAVYLGEREGDYVKQAAVKLIRHGIGTELMTRRFRTERQILARLEHPHIARLLEGGTTESGVPYVALEYVEGSPLDVFCAERGLNVSERINLFRKVCEAVQYAHRNLIVHRDIKPGNILVTDEGVPKLLDFGIAKLLASDSNGDQTVTTFRMMTPRYAAPEQIKGEPVTTATDVYSLGVALYELLAGRSPYPIDAASVLELERAVCESDPEPPSVVVKRSLKASTDGKPPKNSAKLIEGDLDTIVVKALNKDPARRYASVEQFSEDLRRYREGLPVTARPDRFTYRAAKFIRRNKTGVVAASLVFLTLLTGIAATAWQARVARLEKTRAERRFNDVRNLASSFLNELSPMMAAPESRDAQRVLIRKTLEYLDKVAADAQDDVALQRELAHAYYVVGDNLGNPYTENLGDTVGALQNYRKALAIAERLAAAEPDNLDVRHTLATCYTNIGEVLAVTGDTAGAHAHYQKGLPLHESVALNRRQPDTRIEWMVLTCRLGNILIGKGENRRAWSEYEKAAGIGERLLNEKPDDVTIRRLYLLMKLRVGEQILGGGNPEEAAALVERTVVSLERLWEENPTNPLIQGNLGSGFELLGLALLWSGRTDDAATAYRKALDLTESQLALNPKNMQMLENRAACLENLAFVSAMRGDFGNAVRTCRQTLVEVEKLAASAPDKDQLQQRKATVLALSAYISEKAGNPPPPLRSVVEAAAALDSLLKKDERNASLKLEAGWAFIVFGKVHARAGDIVEAERLTRLGLSLLRELADRPEAWVTERQKYAEALVVCEPVALRDPKQAVAFAKRAAEQSQGKNVIVSGTLAEARAQAKALTNDGY